MVQSTGIRLDVDDLCQPYDHPHPSLFVVWSHFSKSQIKTCHVKTCGTKAFTVEVVLINTQMLEEMETYKISVKIYLGIWCVKGDNCNILFDLISQVGTFERKNKIIKVLVFLHCLLTVLDLIHQTLVYFSENYSPDKTLDVEKACLFVIPANKITEMFNSSNKLDLSRLNSSVPTTHEYPHHSNSTHRVRTIICKSLPHSQHFWAKT